MIEENHRPRCTKKTLFIPNFDDTLHNIDAFIYDPSSDGSVSIIQITVASEGREVYRKALNLCLWEPKDIHLPNTTSVNARIFIHLDSSAKQPFDRAHKDFQGYLEIAIDYSDASFISFKDCLSSKQYFQEKIVPDGTCSPYNGPGITDLYVKTAKKLESITRKYLVNYDTVFVPLPSKKTEKIEYRERGTSRLTDTIQIDTSKRSKPIDTPKRSKPAPQKEFIKRRKNPGSLHLSLLNNAIWLNRYKS